MRLVGGALGLVVLGACGPAHGPGWTIAVAREEAEGPYSRRVWLVHDDGRDALRVPDSPQSHAASGTLRHDFVGWSPDGRGFYLLDQGAWFFTGGRFEPMPCDDEPPYGCIWSSDDPLIVSSGQVVVPHEVSEAHFPGINPTPKAYLIMIDQQAGTGEIIDEAEEYECVSAGAGGVIVATSVHYEYQHDSDADPRYTISRRPFMHRDGVREELDGLTSDFHRCTVVAPTGELVAWPVESGTAVTDLEGRERHVVPHGGAAEWSDDARWLGGIDRDGVWLLDVATGRLDRLELTDVRAIHWSPDGHRVAVREYCPEESVVEIWSRLRIYEFGGRWEEVRLEPCAPQHWIGWTPDSEGFARQRQEDGIDGFRVVSVLDGGVGPFIEGRGLAFRPDA